MRRSLSLAAQRSLRLCTALCVVAVMLVSVGCSTDGPLGETDTRNTPWWNCPPVVANTNGLLHGKKCTTGSECMYGQCIFGSFIVGYDLTKGICTKNSNCASKDGGNGATVACAVDNTSTDFFYTTIEKTSSGGNDKRTNPEPHKICTVGCKSDGDCVSYNPETPHCIKSSTKYVSVGTHGACGIDPFKT